MTVRINGRVYTRTYFTNITGGQTVNWIRDDGCHFSNQKFSALKRKYGYEVVPGD